MEMLFHSPDTYGIKSGGAYRNSPANLFAANTAAISILEGPPVSM
jgi:hypothetical protein